MVKLSVPEARECRTCKEKFTAEYSSQFYCSSCWKKRNQLSSSRSSNNKYCGQCEEFEEILTSVKRCLEKWIKLIKKC